MDSIRAHLAKSEASRLAVVLERDQLRSRLQRIEAEALHKTAMAAAAAVTDKEQQERLASEQCGSYGQRIGQGDGMQPAPVWAMRPIAPLWRWRPSSRDEPAV